MPPEPTTPAPDSDSSVARAGEAAGGGGSSTPAGREGGRPLAVYGVLVLGVATLLILLGIIYFSSGDRDRPEQPICTNLSASDVEQAVYEDRVERLTVNYDDTGDPRTGKRYGPVVSRVDFRDGQCAYLPQGVEAIDQTYQVLGAIEFYNDTTENSQVEIVKERSDILTDSLFWTSTPLPTETLIPTETPIVTETPTPEATATPTEDTTGPATPDVVASPETEGTPEAAATPAS
jgi:hypothetical protein